ncbi:MAG: lipid A biosynthesis acyltransferase [Anaeromyxobacter sp. RBG_16_69_14]|nr:MAG: lipid A biosynthesis acyltransferase [Anaeromyxobacter sp. RBG_16_69_14]
MEVPLRKRVKRAVRSALLRAAVRLLSWLPLGPALLLGSVVGRLAWLFARRERRLMLEHLALAFPEKSGEERRAIARASLAHLGQVAMEVIAVHGCGRIDEYVSFAPGCEEIVRRAMARGKGLIFVAGHIGNWELLARRLALVTQPNAVIAKRNADPRLNELMARFRAGGGNKTLWREDPATGRELIKLFRQGGALGILIDQDTKVQGVFVPFFGRPAFTPRAVGDLALRFGATVVVGTSHRRGPRPGAGHELDIIELSYDSGPADPEAEVERITAAAAALQEAAIRRNPTEWVWMHRRWKTTAPVRVSQAKAMPKSRELSGT